MIDLAPATRSLIVSKQIAHNAIVGHDQPDLLRTLVEQIDNADDLLATGLDESIIGAQAEQDGLTLFAPRLDFDYRTVSLSFLPHQQADLERLCESLDGRQDLLVTGMEEQFEALLKTAVRYARIRKVINGATAISLMVQLALDEVDAEEQADEAKAAEVKAPERVSLAKLFGSRAIPREAAETIMRALAKMQDDGDVTERNRWQALEYWAAEYLAGD